jgi:hypothetical protein
LTLDVLELHLGFEELLASESSAASNDAGPLKIPTLREKV